MITWNYRVFHEDDDTYSIREVFYDEQGHILGCTAEAVEPIGSSLAELAEDIGSFQAALALPVLTLADLPPLPNAPIPSDRTHNRSLEAVFQELQLSPSSQTKRHCA